MSLRAFSWYVTPLGLAVAVIGFAVLVRRRFWRDPGFFLTAAIFSGFFFYKLRVVPEHFGMTRRFLPVILPAALLSASGGLIALAGETGLGSWLSVRLRRLRSARITMVATRLPLLAALLLLGLLGWWFWGATRPVARHVEYAGLIPRLEALSKRFADEDLVLVESRNASDLHVFALPLAYIYARNVLVLASPRPDKLVFARFLDEARQKYHDVYFLGGGGTDLRSRGIGVEAVASDRFQVPEYESRQNGYPRGVREKEFDYGLYRFVPPATKVQGFALDVGRMDDLHVVRFHAKEQMGDVTFRWTRDVSYVSVFGIGPETRRLTLWMNDGRRPSSVSPAMVTIFVDDRELGRVLVLPDFHPYSFEIPADLAATAASRSDPSVVKITVNTWSPRSALGTPDDRQLGVMVDRVEVQ
jgi:hypothetical protein